MTEDALHINGVEGSTFETPDGLTLHVERQLGDGLLKILELPSGLLHRPEDPLTGERTMPDVAWFERMLGDGMLRKLADRDGPVPSVAQSAAPTLTRDEILALDPYAEARQLTVVALMDRGVARDDPALGRHLAAVWKGDLAQRFGKQPAPATVRSWYDRCRADAVDIADMMRMSGRVRRSARVDPTLEVLYARWTSRYYTNRGYRIVDSVAGATAEVLKINAERREAGLSELDLPNRETMRRRINASLCRETYAAKWGEDAARRKWDGAGKGVRASRILQICLMDDTVLDAVVCLDRGMVAGRPYVCAILDVHSRVCPSITVSFTPPTVHTAAACLRRANRPKSVRPDRLAAHPVLGKLFGKAAEIITDDGTNYVSPSFGSLLMDLGIKHRLAAVGEPRHKAIIERFFHSLNTFLVGKLPGSTLDPSIMRKLGIDPEKEAVVTLDELRLLIEEFLYVYHVSVHSGISVQPALAWERSMRLHGRDVILDERRLDALSGVTIRGKRITANGGCRLFGLVYKSDQQRERIVEPLAGREPHRKRLEATTACSATIVYDPEDLGTIHVRVGADLVPLHATDPEYATGLSLWQHRRIQAFAKREAMRFNTPQERLAARAELNRTVLEAFPDLDARERRAAARLFAGPCAPDGHPTVEFATAEPRHDGLGPTMGQELGADHRDDADRPQSRPSGRSGSRSEDDGRDEGDAGTGERPGVGADLVFDMPADDDRRFEELR